MNSDALFPVVHVADKRQALSGIAERFGACYGVDTARVLDRLTEREKLGSTGFGRGIAIPHGKIDGLDRPVALFMQLEKPIGFDAVDSLPVDLIFALLSPENSGAMHLQALAGISRLMRDEARIAKLRGARTPDALFALLSEESERSAA